MPPDNGFAARTSGGRSCRSEVTKMVFMSGPPKHGAVGLEHGNGMLLHQPAVRAPAVQHTRGDAGAPIEAVLVGGGAVRSTRLFGRSGDDPAAGD